LSPLKGGVRPFLSFKALLNKHLPVQINNFSRSEIVVSPFEGGLRGMTLNLSEIQPTMFSHKTIFNSIQTNFLKISLTFT
jgi:hypothetical protein